MKRYFFIAFLLLITFSLYWVWKHQPELKAKITDYIENKEVTTLKQKYSYEEIMDTYASRYQKKPTKMDLKYYPYLMMEVKYLSGKKNLHEGILLWNMTNGEMVLDCDSWEMSNGFEICLLKQASRADFKVLNSLVRLGGRATKQRLIKELNIEQKELESWIYSAYHKNLISQEGKTLSLQFFKPKFYVPPISHMREWIDIKTYYSANKASSKYQEEEITSLAKAAFGNNFTIKNHQVVYLPIFTIKHSKDDGTLHTTHWNTLTGKEMQYKNL